MSVLVEAGGEVNASFMPYIDKLYHFIAPKILGDNSGRSCFNGTTVNKITNCISLNLQCSQTFDPDILITYTKM